MPELTNAVNAYTPLSNLGQKYGAGTNLYMDSLGVNGPGGNANATGAFQASPGYNWQRDQAIEATARNANRFGAGGNELALHCDLVVASQKARFGMSLAQVGLAPNWFLAKKLMEVLGPVTTREMLLLGDPLPSTKLFALGLIARCVPAGELEAEATKVIDRLAANAPLSLKAMKALTVRQLEFRDAIRHDDVDALVQAAMKSQDAQEGMKARLEKRTAKFQGK